MSVQTATLWLPADRARTLRTAGGVGMAAGLLFAAMSVWEHAAGLDSGATGLARDVSQGGFALAMVGYVVLLVGVHIARPGGDSRPARAFTALVVVAWIAFLAGMAVAAVTSRDAADGILGPVGGLAQGIGLIGMGVTTARAGRWSGWRRFMPLALAAVFVAVLFVPSVVGSEPSALAESVWALGYSGLGLALLIEQGDRTPLSRGQYILGAAVVAAVVTSAAVVTFSTASASSIAPERASGTIGSVQAGPVYGSADALEHQVQPSSPIFGSADSLEHQGQPGTPTFGSADSLERQAG